MTQAAHMGVDMFRLDGKVALVTGASRGLGLAIARSFAAAGATVVLAARDEAKLREAVADIEAAGGQAGFEPFDMNDEQAVLAAFGRVVERFGAPHILVNNAGLSPRPGLFESTMETWEEVMRTNLRSVFLLCREAARGMIPRKDGRIINVTSYMATVGRDRGAAYSASKGGLAALTRSLAGDLGRYNITVNAISPGLFMTDMSAPVKENPLVLKRFNERIALGRPGEPHEVAGAALFLASTAGSYVTGASIDVDGGVANVTPISFRP